MRSKCFISVLLSWQLSIILAQQTCYWPNGSSPAAGHVDLINCYSSQASICCAKGDMCMSNGLCFSGAVGLAYRGGCTEQNWNNITACPLWCNDIYPGSTANVFNCPSTTLFYCDHNLSSQCQNGGAGFADCTSAKILGTPPIGSAETAVTANACIVLSSTSIAGSAASITSTSAQSPTCTQIIHKSSPPATAIGVGLGVPLGIAATGFLIFLLRRDVWRKGPGGAKQDILGDNRTRGRYTPTDGEVDGSGLQRELQGTVVSAELHGNGMVQKP